MKLWWHSGIAVVCVACGTSSSATSGSSGNGTSLDGSDGTYVLASLDDECGGKGGPTGRQVVDPVGPAYAGTYTPPSDRTPPAPAWKGPTAASPVAMSAAYAGGKITCRPKQVVDCPPGAPCAAPQPASVSVEIAIALKTADGVFDEHFTGTATSPNGDGRVLWRADLPATKIGGTYPISAGTKDEVHLAFSGQLAGPGSQSGAVSELTTKISFSAGQWTSSPVDRIAEAGAD